MKLGLRSKEEWTDYLEDGRVYQNKYLPSRPDEMYANEWVSWEEFLGIMRPYEETRYMVQRVLRIKTMEEYKTFINADPKRAEGLRIPYKPDIVYKDKGWINSEHFFAVEEDGTKLIDLLMMVVLLLTVHAPLLLFLHIAEDNGDYRCSL